MVTTGITKNEAYDFSLCLVRSQGEYVNRFAYGGLVRLSVGAYADYDERSTPAERALIKIRDALQLLTLQAIAEHQMSLPRGLNYQPPWPYYPEDTL